MFTNIVGAIFSSRRQTSAAEDIGRGVVRLSNGAKEVTLLLVGVSGSGKTAFLTLLANVLKGRPFTEFQVVHDVANEEATGDESRSQTQAAKLMSFESANGVIVHILDTPGLGDTDGHDRDREHQESIEEQVGTFKTVNAVLIIANGTQKRLDIVADYVNTTLMSLMPEAFRNNIGCLHTKIDADTSIPTNVPEILRSAKHFQLDNPVGLHANMKKGLELDAQRRAFEKVSQHYSDALVVLATLFEWIDSLVPQPTAAMSTLFENSRDMDIGIMNALTRLTQMDEIRQTVAGLLRECRGQELTMKDSERFREVVHGIRKSPVTVQDGSHNTCCKKEGCFSNCHQRCQLPFSMDHTGFRYCWAFGGSPAKAVPNCEVCGHAREDHEHGRYLWRDVSFNQEVHHPQLHLRHETAKTALKKATVTRLEAEERLKAITTEMEGELTLVADLSDQYSKLSLSGDFEGLVEKSSRMLKARLETLRRQNAEPHMIKRVEKSYGLMVQKLEVVQQAAALKKRHQVIK